MTSEKLRLTWATIGIALATSYSLQIPLFLVKLTWFKKLTKYTNDEWTVLQKVWSLLLYSQNDTITLTLRESEEVEIRYQAFQRVPKSSDFAIQPFSSPYESEQSRDLSLPPPPKSS